MPILETNRLLFRHHELAELEPFCAMESAAEYLAPQVVHPRAELEKRFLGTWLPPKELGLLATMYKPDGCNIGRCGLYPKREDDGHRPQSGRIATAKEVGIAGRNLR